MSGNFGAARFFVALLAIVIAAALPNFAARAQTIGKTARIVVPYPPGGTADTLSRIIGLEIGHMSGQLMLTENRPGANTVIATEFVSRAVSDGSTLLLMADSFVINPTVRPTLPYDPFAFTPICLLVNSPQVMVVNANSPYKTLGSFVMAAKARPGELNYAAVGPATTQHITGEMFERAAEINLTYVPYTGGGPAVMSILGGHVNAVFANYNEVMGHIAVGRLRPLAVASRARLPDLPDVPTMKESGYKHIETTAWFGVLAPPKTPRETVGLLIAQFKSALAAPEVRAKLIAQGLYPVALCGDEFAVHIRQQYDRYARIIRESNIRFD